MERVDKPTERWLRSVVWWKLGAAECEALDAAEEEFVAVEKAKAAEEAAKAKALEEAWKERAREEARAAAGEVVGGVQSVYELMDVVAAAKANGVVRQRMDEYQKLARRWCVLSPLLSARALAHPFLGRETA